MNSTMASEIAHKFLTFKVCCQGFFVAISRVPCPCVLYNLSDWSCGTSTVCGEPALDINYWGVILHPTEEKGGWKAGESLKVPFPLRKEAGLFK